VKLGANPKKLAVLGGLVLVLVYVAFFLPGGDDHPESSRPAASQRASSEAVTAGSLVPSPQSASSPVAARRTARTSRGAVSTEFRPSLLPGRPEDRPDPLKIDPTLKLGLLAKLQSVTMEGGERSLFDFAQPPAPKAPEPKIAVKPLPGKLGAQANPAAAAAPGPPAKPKAPPIPLKFYGFASPAPTGEKRAFFLDGDEVLIASEGDLVKKRYKVVRIGLNSVVMEDVQFKDQQTLGLVAEMQGT
jgi:hypothetical protein